MKLVNFRTPRVQYYSMRHKNLMKVRKNTRWRRSNVVVYTTPFSPIDYAHMFLSSITGKTIIINMVYSTFLRMYEEHNFIDILSYKFEKWFLKAADVVIVDTHTFKKAYARIFKVPEAKFRVLYGFTDTKSFKPVDVEKDYDIVYHGSYVKNHGTKTLIDFAIKYKDMNLKYLMIGGGYNNRHIREEAIKRVQEHGLEDQFEFLGEIDFENLHSLLSRSKYGVGSLSGSAKANGVLRSGLLEVMSCGLLPISANTYETAKNVTINGIRLIEPDSPKAIADLVQEYQGLSDETYQTYSQECRNFVIENFSLQSLKRQFDKIVEEAEKHTKFGILYVSCFVFMFVWSLQRVFRIKRF